jgi:aminopeptidase N
METVYGNDLDSFFQQWLWQPGHPKLKVEWEQKSNEKLELTVTQIQPDCIFSFPLEIEIQYKNGDAKYKTIEINKRKTELSSTAKSRVEKIVLDPNTKLLFEEN